MSASCGMYVCIERAVRPCRLIAGSSVRSMKPSCSAGPPKPGICLSTSAMACAMHTIQDIGVVQ
eukprot:scaffold1683_cov20-Prasinocladus_malaysianus.AAC.1